MAIDDNTSYELTGAQVKDLANKIKGKASDNTFVGATPAAPGSKGLVPEPQAGDNAKFLSGDGTWKEAGSSYTAGNGIDITNNTISADTNVLATTELVKNLAGGAPRVANRINVSRLSDYEEATEISNQINNPDVYPALLVQTLMYAFYDVDWGKYLNRREIGQAIDENCNFVYFSTTGDDGYGKKIIVNAKSNHDSEADTYSPSFLIYEINAKTPYGGGKMYTLSLNASTQPGLGDWYETSSSTWAYEPAFVIQRMTITEAEEIANEINANNPDVLVTASQVRTYMKFVCRSASTGKMIQTASGFRSALARSSAGSIMFLPTMTGTSVDSEVMTFRGGTVRNAGFNLMNMNTSFVTIYNIVDSSSSYGENAERMWYVAEIDNEYAYQLSYGYTNAITNGAPTDAPETTFQTAVDASGNLYMASGSSSASDWKQINNVPATVNNGALTIQQNGTTLDTFTANSSDDKTVNIQTITAETVAPAEEVGAITASMIDWSTIVMKGTWTTTQALPSIGASTQVTIDISSLGLSTADDYVVTVTNRMISSNSWATALVVTDRTSSSFTIKLFNSHWSGGTIGAGNIIDWAVFKVA